MPRRGLQAIAVMILVGVALSLVLRIQQTTPGPVQLAQPTITPVPTALPTRTPQPTPSPVATPTPMAKFGLDWRMFPDHRARQLIEDASTPTPLGWLLLYHYFSNTQVKPSDFLVFDPAWQAAHRDAKNEFERRRVEERIAEELRMLMNQLTENVKRRHVAVANYQHIISEYDFARQGFALLSSNREEVQRSYQFRDPIEENSPPPPPRAAKYISDTHAAVVVANGSAPSVFPAFVPMAQQAAEALVPEFGESAADVDMRTLLNAWAWTEGPDGSPVSSP